MEQNSAALTGKSWSADRVTEAIVSDIAAREGTSPEELTTTLYEVVDPDALANLFRPTAGGRRRGRVVFPFYGYTVTVTSDEEVRVTADAPADSSTDAATDAGTDSATDAGTPTLAQHRTDD